MKSERWENEKKWETGQFQDVSRQQQQQQQGVCEGANSTITTDGFKLRWRWASGVEWGLLVDGGCRLVV